MTEHYYLGVDMGGTATRWAVVDSVGNEVARGRAPGATGLIFEAASRATFVGTLEAMREVMPGRIDFAHFGITGAGFSRHRQIEQQIEDVFGLPAGCYHYSNDMLLGWHAAFGGSRGHLVSSGTGSIGVSIDADGNATVVGGRGLLIDDGGSGTWIALRALDRLFRVIDEHGQPKGAEVLARNLFDAIGGSDWDDVRSHVYGSGRGRIGELAVAVAAAVEQGDTHATAIITAAGGELCRLARALLHRCGPAKIAFVGGVLALHPLISKEIRRQMAGEDIDFPRIDAALAAARMARSKGEAVA
ncbi:MAG: N-acetylglucosamine kinase [Geminicoccaceae bacterium]|nr:N-acetylglucosamine kinase [Geminicoccaceae bacterium]